MDRQEINEYVEQSQQLIESSPQMDEENTKVKLVQPFLDLLGWDLYSTEVSLEYTVPMASGSTHVDYALLVGDSPVVFVEVKPVSSSLTEKNVRQLQSYMRQELDVDWGVLTNGKSFEVLTKSRDRNEGEEVSVVQFDLDDLVEKPDILELLSKESIRSGKSDEIAQQVAQTNRSIGLLQKKEDTLTDSISSTVEGEVGELNIDVDEHARDFVQHLVSVLREQRQFVRTDKVDEEPADLDTKQSPEEDESTGPPDRQGYVIRFSDGHEVPPSGEEVHTQQRTNMGEAVDYLVREYDLLSNIEIPYLPDVARKNCTINAEPVHPGGDEMRGPYELSNGYYLHTSLNTNEKKKRIRDVADQVDLSVEFLGEW